MVKRDEKSSLFFYPDIYNKLYNMIKQTWEISNEERNRILSLHESATKNFYLMSEQEANDPVIAGEISSEDDSEPKWELKGFTVIQKDNQYYVFRPKDLRYRSQKAYLAYKEAITDKNEDTYIPISTLSELSGVIEKSNDRLILRPNELTQNSIYVGEMMTLVNGYPDPQQMNTGSDLFYCAFDTEKNLPVWGQISLKKGLYLGAHSPIFNIETVGERPGKIVTYKKTQTSTFGIEVNFLRYGTPSRPRDTPDIIIPPEEPKITTFDIVSPFEFDKTELTGEAEVKFKEFVENIKKFYNGVTGDVTVTTSASIDSDPIQKEKYNMDLSKKRAQVIIYRLRNESGNKTLNFIPNPIGQTDKFKPGAKWPEVKDNSQTAPNRRLIIKLPEITQ
jgi:outer membrane protein OmpA-like peptidoglycan-associated protein